MTVDLKLIRATKAELLEASGEQGWHASVGVGLVDVESRRAGVIVTITSPMRAAVSEWVEKHPQPVEVRIEVVDNIDARSI